MNGIVVTGNLEISRVIVDGACYLANRNRPLPLKGKLGFCSDLLFPKIKQTQ